MVVFYYRLCNGKSNPDTFSASFSPFLLKDQKNKAFIEWSILIFSIAVTHNIKAIPFPRNSSNNKAEHR